LSDDDDDEQQSVTFAPKDVCPVSFEGKENLHGLGYHGLDPRRALGHFSLMEPPAVSGGARKRGIRGQVGLSDETFFTLVTATMHFRAFDVLRFVISACLNLIHQKIRVDACGANCK
jgi:hypothetical protein